MTIRLQPLQTTSKPLDITTRGIVDISAKGNTDYQYEETFIIQELKPAFNVNVGSEKLLNFFL